MTDFQTSCAGLDTSTDYGCYKGFYYYYDGWAMGQNWNWSNDITTYTATATSVYTALTTILAASTKNHYLYACIDDECTNITISKLSGSMKGLHYLAKYDSLVTTILPADGVIGNKKTAFSYDSDYCFG